MFFPQFPRFFSKKFFFLLLIKEKEIKQELKKFRASFFPPEAVLNVLNMIKYGLGFVLGDFFRKSV
jgi:hypothetical protein